MINANNYNNLESKNEDLSNISEENANFLTAKTDCQNRQPAIDLFSELKKQYRLIKKKTHLLLKKNTKNYTNVLYVTDGNYSKEYILSFQKQYPDKVIFVIVPHIRDIKNSDKQIAEFDYNIQNKQLKAKLYKYSLTSDNIQVYGIYSEKFSKLENLKNLYKIQYLIHYVTCVRLAVRKLHPDIIHSENIPFYLGEEFTQQKETKFKVLQTVHDFYLYQDIEPFWAIINLINKKELKKICNDNIIKKNITALFGIKKFKNFSKIKVCLEYLYNNFEKYRETFNQYDDTNENVLINRLNERVCQIFPNIFYKNKFNPIYYSIKKAKNWAINSVSEKIPIWAQKFYHNNYIERGINTKINSKIAHPFDITNFRYYREYNKIYLVKEFSEKQIKTNFTDFNLFSDEEVKIYGYLDSFYKGTLLLAPLENLKDIDLKTIVYAVLKCFERKKNIQIIFNKTKVDDNKYFKSLIDFLESQPSLEGKWLFVEGKINLAQFAASSDIILLPSGDAIGEEDILYTALQYGCIPVTSNSGIFSKVVIDIFDDITSGFGFKESQSSTNTKEDGYTNILLKALHFYVHNFTSWKILIENAMNYDSSWSFELIQKYNALYEDIF